MKDEETNYLNKLFTRSSDQADESENDFPLVDVPVELTNKLHAITETSLNSSSPGKLHMFKSWPKASGIAASLLVAVIVFQVYQQQQTLKQLEQAQADLVTALHYLGEANEITRAQMMNTLNANMKKAAVAPVVEIGRDAVFPNFKSRESETQTPNRTL